MAREVRRDIDRGTRETCRKCGRAIEWEGLYWRWVEGGVGSGICGYERGVRRSAWGAPHYEDPTLDHDPGPGYRLPDLGDIEEVDAWLRSSDRP